MKAIETLMEEHRVIERVLDSLEKASTRLTKGRTVSGDFFLKATDFIKGFADGCHHKKEEGVLFPALVANGMSRETGPVGVMLAEHEQGRRLTRAMADGAALMQALDTAASAEVARHALGYVALLRQHIQKEDNILFPMADRLIPPEQQAALAAEFDRIEREEIGQGVHEKYHALSEELAKED